jgi:hypothetical protein
MEKPLQNYQCAVVDSKGKTFYEWTISAISLVRAALIYDQYLVLSGFHSAAW